MPEFLYNAKNLAGKPASGSISAASAAEATKELAARSLFASDVKPAPASGGFQRRVPGRAVEGAYSRLADLLKAGVPLLRAFEILAGNKQCPPLASALGDVRSRVANGESLREAMHAHPGVFSSLAVNIIGAGEKGGFLESAFRRLAVLTRNQEELKGRLLGALAYPAFLVAAGSIVLVLMLVFFVPRFEPLFERLSDRGELPWATVALLGTSHFCQQYGLWAALILAAAYLIGRPVFATRARRLIDRLKLTVPYAGPMFRSLAIARFCRVLGSLLQNQAPILEALKLARLATGNQLLEEAIATAATSIGDGQSLAGPLAACGYFPEDTVEAISVGQQANNLDGILLDQAASLEDQTNRHIDLVMRLVEPALLLVMAGVILFVMIALLLPVFQLSHGAGGI